MLHLRITLDCIGLGYLDGTGLGDASDVVSCEINEHQVLGALFGIVQQLIGKRFVPQCIASARTRTRDRTNRHYLFAISVFASHQNLGRCTHHIVVAEVVVIHVRCRIKASRGEL